MTHDLPHDGVSTEIHRSGGPFTLVPLPDRDGQHASAVVWMEAGPRAAELAAMPEEAFDAALNLRACGVLGELAARRAGGGSGRSSPRSPTGSTGRARRWSPRRRTWCRRSGRRG